MSPPGLKERPFWNIEIYINAPALIQVITVLA